jgi:cyclophilin family peptidyl-prolyl cis-trans isomerase
MRYFAIVGLLVYSHLANAQKVSKKDYLVTLETNKGTIHLVLFDDTPLHKANFLKLAEEGFYNGTLFHRVKNDFMIQGGDPLSKNAAKGARLGAGGGELARIPYEFTTKHVHLKGTLAAARTGNPEKASSGCQFYIVTGKKYTEQQIIQTERSLAAKQEGREPFTYTEEQKEAYKEIGGTPFLDNNYTVYGQVIQGIEVADVIQKVEVDRADRPIDDVSMTVTVKKMKKKKITKLYGYTFL